MLYLVTPIFSVFLLRFSGEKINEVGIISFVSLCLFVFSIVGTAPLFYYIDQYRYDIGVQDQFLILKVLFYSCCNLVFFILGAVFLRRACGLKPVPFRSSDMAELKGFQILILIFLFVLCVWVLFNYLSRIEKVALFVAINEGPEAAMKVRSDMGNNFSGRYHWYELAMNNIALFLTFVGFSSWVVKKTAFSFFVFLVLFIYSAFVSLMAVEKAPFAWMLVGLFMVYFLSKRDGRVKVSGAIFLVSLVVILVSIFYVLFMGTGSAGSALWSVFSRTFAGSISPAYFYLEFFPEQTDYLFGATLPNPGGILPHVPYLFTIEVMNWVFPWHLEKGVVGTAPTVFWGEAYANFGEPGIPVVAFCMGLLLAAYSYLISKLEVSPITIGFLVWFILTFKNLSVTGFGDYLYSVNVFVMFSVLFLLLFSGGRLKIRSSI